jgi:multiple sugar transport system permease protein
MFNWLSNRARSRTKSVQNSLVYTAVLQTWKIGSRIRQWHLGARFVPYSLLSPAVILLLVLCIASSLYGIYLSFLDWNYFRLDRRLEFVGLQHYYSILADPLFLNAVRKTVVWSAVVVPLSFVAGLYLALLLNEEIRAKWFFRTAILLPWATPLVVVGIVWSFMLAPGIGPVNELFVHAGFHDLKYKNWLFDLNLALPIVMIVQVWRWAPFFAITLLAGLQSIPSDFYDAAEIDGAGLLARFRYVTLPLLWPVASVVILQGFIWSFHNFTLVFILTGGGPANATELLTIYLWRNAFPLGQLGKAAAVGTILVAILSVTGSIWVMKVLNKESIE